jgi:hypothetical protein
MAIECLANSEALYHTFEHTLLVTLAAATSCAGAPYHVDRSKLFILARFRHSELIDCERVARMIEFTRFQVPAPNKDVELDAETGLVRAADLIRQLGDPNYIRKANAIFQEFAEIGLTRQLGYASPADLVESYPGFFWSQVSAHIAPALRHLNVTLEGRR